MKSRYLKICFVIALLMIAVPVRAQSQEAVTTFAQTTELSRTGEATITHAIDYDYGSVPPHDISYRLPLSYHDDQGRDYRLAFKLLGATSDGEPVSLKTLVTPQTVTLTLPAGSSPTTTRTFTIRYTLKPVVLTSDAGDAFRTSVTGLGWTVPINRASMELRAPISPQDVVCYTGTQSTNTSTCQHTESGNKVTLSTDAILPPGAAMNAFVGFPRGSFNAYLEPHTTPQSWFGPAIAVLILLLALLAAIIIPLRLRARRLIVASSSQDYTKTNEAPKDQA